MKDNIIQFFKREWLWFAGGAIGAVAGYLYWLFIGCNSGTCAITSSPINSTLYGVLLGGLTFNMFKKSKRENNG